jgi:hypothetical protein
MTRSLFAVLSSTVLFALALGVQAAPKQAPAQEPVLAPAGRSVPAGDRAMPKYDLKKKLPGAACKSADECQQHHTCEKVGDKKVCKEPPEPQLPPGAVT